MLKLLTIGTLGSALVCGMIATASAQTMPPPNPPNIRYILPGAADSYSADRLGEGRSIYRMEAPRTFWHGVDERGYPSGLPENPHLGG